MNDSNFELTDILQFKYENKTLKLSNILTNKG